MIGGKDAKFFIDQSPNIGFPAGVKEVALDRTPSDLRQNVCDRMNRLRTSDDRDPFHRQLPDITEKFI